MGDYRVLDAPQDEPDALGADAAPERRIVMRLAGGCVQRPFPVAEEAAAFAGGHLQAQLVDDKTACFIGNAHGFRWCFGGCIEPDIRCALLQLALGALAVFGTALFLLRAG